MLNCKKAICRAVTFKLYLCGNRIMGIASRQDIIDILEDNGINEQLFAYADKVRQKYKGSEVHLRGLIEFSNICGRSCKYCGLRCGNKKLERYRMTPEEIISCAKAAVNKGYKTIVLQSGEDDYFSAGRMCRIISEIKKLNTALTLSLGEKSYDEYKAYKDAGADRYLLRIETTDKELYKSLHPNMSLENRIRCLKDLKALGFETGTGILTGLPGQTAASIADDILFFKELDADMIGTGPFIPHPDTPLKDCPAGSFELALKVSAIARILLKDINITASSAMETVNPNGRIIALKSGANAAMPNLTPALYRGKYEIYPGKICINESPDMCLNCISAKIKSIGRTVSSSFGFRRK